MAGADGPLQVPHHCREKCSGNLVWPSLQLELLARRSRVKGLLLPELRVESETCNHSLVELAHYLCQVIPILVLNNPVFKVLQVTLRKGKQSSYLLSLRSLVAELTY